MFGIDRTLLDFSATVRDTFTKEIWGLSITHQASASKVKSKLPWSQSFQRPALVTALLLDTLALLGLANRSDVPSMSLSRVFWSPKISKSFWRDFLLKASLMRWEWNSMLDVTCASTESVPEQACGFH